MNFKKITNTDKIKKDFFSVDDVKMVKLSFIFPVWKNSKPDEILSEFSDSDIFYLEKFELEEASPSVKDLEDFQKTIKGDWYFYHRDHEVTLKKIIEASKKKPAKNESKISK